MKDRKFFKVINIMLMVMIIIITTYIKAFAKDLDVEVNMGYGGNLKVGSNMPITVKIKSDGRDIDGRVQVSFSSDFNGTGYEKDINIPRGGEKQITVYAPLNTINGKCFITIFEKDKKIYDDYFTLKAVDNDLTTYVGILSDSFDKLSYMYNVPTNGGGKKSNPGNSSLQGKNIRLNEENFPQEKEALYAFQSIVIDNFDTSKLSKLQINALKEWIKDGGVLVLGTGDNGNKTLAALNNDLIKYSIGNSKNVATKAFTSKIESSINEVQQINIVELKVEDSQTLVKEGNDVLVQKVRVEEGCIVINSFDLALEPFNSWKENLSFAKNLYGLAKSNYLDHYRDGRDHGYYTINEIGKTMSIITVDKIKVLSGIIGLYIIIAAPILYIILKKKDKRECMWWIVPGLAVVFSVGVYSLGADSRVKGARANLVYCLDLNDEGVLTGDSYSIIKQSTKKEIRIGTKDNKILEPINVDYGPRGTTDKDNLRYIIHTGNSNWIQSKDKSLISDTFLKIPFQQKKIGQIDANIDIDGNNVTGNIKNSTSIDFEEAYLFVNGNYFKLGNFKKGDSVELKNGEKAENIYDINQKINQNAFGPQVFSQEGIEKRQAERRRLNLFEARFNNGYRGDDDSKAIFIAYPKNIKEDTILVNGKEVAQDNYAIVTSNVKLNFEKNGYVNYPKGFVPYTIAQGSSLGYDKYGNGVNGSGSAEVIYSIGRPINYEEVSIQINHGRAKISIWNSVKKEWSPIDVETTTIKDEQIKSLVNSQGEVRLKIELKDDYIQIPKVGMKGRVK